MFKKNFAIVVGILFLAVILLAACNTADMEGKLDSKTDRKTSQTAEEEKTDESDIQNVGPHEGVNQEPIPINVERTSEHEVEIDMTAQITDVEIDEGEMYKAWTFNGTVPGPVIRVKEGDSITFNLENMDPKIPHSVDFHSVYASPEKDFGDVLPEQTGTFTYDVGSAGVFMYHCATEPVLDHIANGMYGTMIVEPADGYPTDDEIDQEITIVQSEFYNDGNHDEMLNGQPEYVLFNGSTQEVKGDTIEAEAGDKIRVNFLDAGPNEVSSFHVIGSQLETVYIDGDPRNVQYGLQTAMVPVSGSIVVEFTLKEPRTYSMVTHAFDHVTKGAVGTIEVK